MSPRRLSGLLVLAVLGVLGCKSEASSPVKEISASELVELQRSGPVAIFDANEDSFRRENGIIPGAVLLTSFRTYDVATTLPARRDQPLVFYCVNRF